MWVVLWINRLSQDIPVIHPTNHYNNLFYYFFSRRKCGKKNRESDVLLRTIRLRSVIPIGKLG